jgi:hypothetical protein
MSGFSTTYTLALFVYSFTNIYEIHFVCRSKKKLQTDGTHLHTKDYWGIVRR